MPENDVTKMKVADLKRELKIRGLTTTGNKNELIDRLQTALIDGELSLEDTAISGEDLLDEDAVLTDEDEAKILGGDENELLKSPTINATALKLNLDVAGVDEDAVLASPTISKKIVLKRKISTSGTSSEIINTTKENTEPSPGKSLKMSERNPITMGDQNSTPITVETAASKGIASKVSQLTMQERLEMRAKKFGISTNADKSATIAVDLTKPAVNAISNEKQMELLKKRADRFGVVVSTEIAKIDADEKLQKRKERFGAAAEPSPAASTTNSTEWSEKARLRLERFKTTQTTTVGSTTAASTSN